MSLRDTLADNGLKMMNLLHRAVLKITGGRVGHDLGGMLTVELHATGRKSGQRRSVLLTSPVHDEKRIVLIASKGGDDRHPEWYKNLVAEPDVELTVRGDTKPWRARTADVDEKAELWPKIVSTYKGYASYQKRTDRDIPVVICEPRSA